MDEVKVSLYLPEADALALAQFVKRVGWDEIRSNAVSDEEAYQVKHALAKLMTGLADEGFAPR